MNMKQFWKTIDIKYPDLDSCWQWLGGSGEGYGSAEIDGVYGRVHKIAYEAVFGPVEEGYELHHRCENPGCCNPYHTQKLTISEHRSITSFARWKSSKELCPRGHRMEGFNLYIQPDGYRKCRKCRSMSREEKLLLQ